MSKNEQELMSEAENQVSLLMTCTQKNRRQFHLRHRYEMYIQAVALGYLAHSLAEHSQTDGCTAADMVNHAPRPPW